MQKRIHLRAQKTIQISSPTVTIIRNLSSGTAFREEHSIHLCQKKKKKEKKMLNLVSSMPWNCCYFTWGSQPGGFSESNEARQHDLYHPMDGNWLQNSPSQCQPPVVSMFRKWSDVKQFPWLEVMPADRHSDAKRGWWWDRTALSFS